MELKRYVLLTNGKIIDNKGYRKIYCDLHWDIARWWYVINKNEEREFNFSEVVKSSDTMTDLIEVGDLVEWNNLLGNLVDVNINKVKYIKLDRIEWNGGAVSPKDVLAIYKKQSNGDFKRYEVTK